MSGKYKAPTVKKAFQILKVISDTGRGMGISELSKGLGISKSTVHGVASALESVGAVIRNPSTKRYTLGITLFELGRSAYSRVDLKDAARPSMENLVEKTRQSVFLGVRNGDHVTIIDMVESRDQLKISAPVGATIPLLAGAIGKVFLSCMNDDQAREYIESKGLPAYTEKTISDPEAYIREVRTVRENRCAIDDEEYMRGVMAAAAPVRGVEHLSAAIWLVGVKPNMDGDKMAYLVKEIKEAADSISQQIERLKRRAHGLES
ncbi:MAG: IclR family transcriptional regulator [Desulfobacterales bacterium]|nr:IclR family transcriptional regulator [Desulfobacterales bacterium]